MEQNQVLDKYLKNKLGKFKLPFGKEEITEKFLKKQMSPGGPAKYIENLNPAKIIERHIR